MNNSQADTETPRDDGVRLQKVLANAGVGSRRVCEQLITAGRVTVDGVVVDTLGARVDPAVAALHVDGKRVVTDTELVYFAVNKPLGVVTTMADDQGRPTVADLVPPGSPRVFHVGRLDAETEGLLLMTNDGELAHRLTHPSYGVEKTYVARVTGEWTREDDQRLARGVEVDGKAVEVSAHRLRQVHAGESIVELQIHEGRNHIVRRLMDELSHPVTGLARIRFGPVRLGGLRAGSSRALSMDEVQSLYSQVDM